MSNTSQSNKKPIKIGIRPEHVIVNDEGLIKLKVNLVELLGSEYYLHFDFVGKQLLVRVNNDHKINVGDEVNISFKNSEIKLFDPITNKNIFF